MTTIRNKQTGETLTGSKGDERLYDFEFGIKGCAGILRLALSEWDILPPPLPTGIGAVVKSGDGSTVWVRVGGGDMCWCEIDSLGSIVRRDTDTTIPVRCKNYGGVAVLSEGVQL